MVLPRNLLLLAKHALNIALRIPLGGSFPLVILLLPYYKCQGKCGNTSVRKDDIENIVIQQLLNECFSEESINEIVSRVQELYQKEKKQTLDDVEPIKRELAELEGKLKNWIEALGSGIKSVIESIKEAEQRKEALEYELQRAEIIQRTQILDESLIKAILEEKKNSLLSADEDEKKQVLQEYVDRVVIQPSKDINKFDAEITYRVFNNGGEGSRTPVRRQRHISFYGCSDSFDVTLETPCHWIPFGSACLSSSASRRRRLDSVSH